MALRVNSFGHGLRDRAEPDSKVGLEEAGNDRNAFCSVMERAKVGPREPVVDDERGLQVNAGVAMRWHETWVAGGACADATA